MIKIKVITLLIPSPAVLCIMLFINGDMSSFPYAKLLGTISSFAAIMLFLNLKLRIKRESS